MLHTLDCRYPGVTRGSVRPIPEADAATRHALQTSNRCVIFIHGFANTPDNATESYEHKHKQLVAAFASANGPDTSTAYFAFHWPGDHPRPWENPATFSARVAAASSAGHVLATAMLFRYPPQGEVILVAHSLGCRVALALIETLNAYSTVENDPGPRVVSAVLMAGAVPIAECDPSSPVFGQRHRSTWCTNLYSPRDRVLMFTFPPGQQGVDHTATAIGWKGKPHNRWDARYNTRLGHSDYWESEMTGVAVALSSRATHTQQLRTHPLPKQALPESILRKTALRGRAPLG